ncbi:hypothetical protein BKE38_01930 [Pseudoroseomonas deserti]|uniref:Uncharacterized protein n=2 Tax=Teichococcus deserti TaxID=1817963 RepID=A0A1V2HA53_9PROT|nr:hypothetical protein BKE38_01930 [Pseudoroseomonas deserti]
MLAFKIGKGNTVYLNVDKIVLVKPHHEDLSKAVVCLGVKQKNSFIVEGSAEMVTKMIDAAQRARKD